MNVFVEFALTLLIAVSSGLLALILASRSHALESRVAFLERTADRIFCVLTGTYVLVFGSLSILRHQSFHSGGLDLGVFDQAIWNSLHGRLLETSLAVIAPTSLGVHFSPLLLGLVPFYAIWDNVIVLLVVQTLALALSALPLYWFARKRISKASALIVVASYLLSPALQSVNLWDFHEIALATPLLAFALYFLLHRRERAFLVCLFLALLTKEEIGFIVTAFGVYLFTVRHRRMLGLSLIFLGIIWVMAAVLWIVPHFRGPARDLGYHFVDRYLYLGDTVPEILKNLVTQPGLAVEHLVVPVKIEFVFHLLVPLVFVPLVGLEVFALSLLTFGYLLLGDNPFQNSIRFQYTAPLLPFVFFACVIGWERISLLLTKSRVMSHFASKFTMAALIGVASLSNYFFQSAGPLGAHFDPSQYTSNRHTALGYELMRLIPADASVLTEGELAAHMAQRRVVYQASLAFPPEIRAVEYLFVDTTNAVHKQFPIIWKDILASPYFETILEQDGYLIKKRATPKITHSAQIQFDGRITLLGYSVESGEPARRGEETRLILTWRAEQNIRERYVTFVHLIDAQNRIWAQDDREPMNGWLRTDRWNAGDVTVDGFTLELPAEMPPGDYRITAGLYATTDQKTLTAYDPSGKLLGSEPVLGILRVVAATK